MSKEPAIINPLVESDWNFDDVPEDEIIACCLREYARESETIALAAEIHWCNSRDIYFYDQYARNPKLKARHDKAARQFTRRAKAVGFDYNAFLERFWEDDTGLIEIYRTLVHFVYDGASPWSELSKELRSKCLREISESLVLRPLSHATVGDLERLWNEYRADLDEVRLRPQYDDSEDAALYSETAPVTLTAEKPAELPGKMTAAFTVDFTRFTDAEICEEMKRWLEANRPTEWKTPKRVFPASRQRGRKRSGKQTEYRTALNRLGLMRLLHWLTPTEIRRDFPNAWRKYEQKQSDFRREVREASKFFKNLFPFLPEKERPQSEARKGVWLSEMMKICDKVEKDLGMKGGN